MTFAEMEKIRTDLKKAIPEFVMENLVSWINSTVLRSVMSFSRASNMPKPFIDHIKIENINGGYAITNDWKGKNDEPLAKFFEFGTVDHWIEPKDPYGVLAFPIVAPNKQKHASAINFKSSQAKTGKTAFSKGHYVSGIYGYQPMTRGHEKGMEKFNRKITSEIQKKFSIDTTQYKIRVKI